MKKVLTVILTCIGLTASAQEYLEGDLNKDGKVDIVDVTILIDKILHQAPVNPTSKACPDGNHPHMIDLGLPSGTLWSCCNVGAYTPESNGLYFAWGETVTKRMYSQNNYSYIDGNSNYTFIGSDIAGTQYDAATANWGAPWRMPTAELFTELVDNTTSEPTTQDDVFGYKFTAQNGRSIFLPAAGYRVGSDLNAEGSLGEYWSSSQHESYQYNARGLILSGGVAGPASEYRYVGMTVRPVSFSHSAPEEQAYTACPNSNHPHWIDLGLPSGTQWRCCNEGAAMPEEVGDFYQFEEVPSAPSSDQILELINNCTLELTDQDGACGQKFIGPNGGTIFLPADRHVDERGRIDYYSYYWSSTPGKSDDGFGLYIHWGDPEWDYYRYNQLFFVRSVRKK